MSDSSNTVGDDPTAIDPLVGTIIADRYQVEKRLGEGGMGAVYLARHVVLEKQVALKILHGEFAGRKDLVERFLHEAKAAARIRHEHVIDISDFGQTAAGNPFFCMELLSGGDLADALRHGQLAWPRIKSIVLQTCSALQAAHEKGIIHRDLKPENIFLIERLGHPDFVKVLDFGIAKLTELEETGKRLTKTGMVFGTPEYMSPEQARGERTDHRVDVYAMGCILFQLISGDVPYRAETFMGVLTRHLFDPPPALPERPDVPPGLEAVVHKAMEKERDQRYASMNELAYAVDALDQVPGVAYYAPGTRPHNHSGVHAAMPATPHSLTKIGTPAPPVVPDMIPPPAPRPVMTSPTRELRQGPSAAAVAAGPAPWREEANAAGPEIGVSTDSVRALADSKKKTGRALWFALGLGVAGAGAAAAVALTGGGESPAAPPELAPVAVPVSAPPAAPPAAVVPDAAPVVSAPVDVAPVASTPPDAAPVALPDEHKPSHTKKSPAKPAASPPQTKPPPSEPAKEAPKEPAKEKEIKDPFAPQ
jgi:serine/threonine protein kinase